MAIKIPTIQRGQAPAPVSVGRIADRAPDAASAFAKTSGALTGAAKQTILAIDKIQNDAINDKSNELNRLYGTYYRNRVYGNSKGEGADRFGLIHKDGDPTKAYNDFDVEADTKFEELISTADLSEKGRRKVRESLSNTHNSLYANRQTAYGRQYDVYSENEKNAAVEIESRSATEAMGAVNVNDKTSLIPFEASISRIKNIQMRHGNSKGTAPQVESGGYKTTDDDGNPINVKMTPQLERQIAKDVSKATANSIKLLLSTKDTERAKYMMDTYSHLIDPVDKPKLLTLFEKIDVENKSLMQVIKMDGKDAAKQRAIINAMKPKTPKQMRVKQETLKLISSNESYKAGMQTRDSKQSYDLIANGVLKKMNSAKPFDSVYQMEQSKVYKAYIGRVTDTKQRQALIEMVTQPKESSEAAFAHNMGLLINGQYLDMSSDQFMQELVGLNSRDRTMFSKWFKTENTESSARENSVANRLREHTKMLFMQSSLAKTRNGKLIPSAAKHLRILQTKQLERPVSSLVGMTSAESMKQGNADVAAYIKFVDGQKTAFSFSNMFDSFFGEEKEKPKFKTEPTLPRGGEPISTPIPGSSGPPPIESLSGKEMDKLVQDFMTEKQRSPTEEELTTWYKARAGK